MRTNYLKLSCCLLISIIIVDSAISQTFEPAIPDSGSTIVYILREPAMLGAAVPWPVTCLNRTNYNGVITKKVLLDEPVVAKLKQKQYYQLSLIANMDYIINVGSGLHYILYSGQSGSVSFLSIKGVKSYMFCHSGEINFMSNSDGDLKFNADLLTQGKKLSGDPSTCQESMEKISNYKPNATKD